MDWTGLLDGMTDLVRDTFGEPFTYTRLETGTTITHSVVTGLPLVAPFDPDHAPFEVGGSVPVSGRITVLDVKLSDLGFEPMKKDEVTVAGKAWAVNEKQASSSGMMKLALRKL